MYDDMIELLNKELKLYQKENELSIDRLKALEENNLERLREIINMEQDLSNHILELENKRMKISEEKGFKGLNLIQVSEKVNDEKIKSEFLKIRKKLLEIIDEIKENNKMCEKYIEIKSKMSKVMLDKIIGNTELGYNEQKQKNKINQNSLLNKKI